MLLYRATTSYFCCGLLVEDGVIRDAAPIVKWAIGKRLVEFSAWIARKHGSLELVVENLCL